MKEFTVLEMTCPFCHTEHYVLVADEDLERYLSGELAQVAFKDLDPTEREQIISQLCPSCQEEIFK